MVNLIIQNAEDGSIFQRIENLTLKELGSVLVEFGKEYFLMFDTIQDVETQVGFTLYIAANRR